MIFAQTSFAQPPGVQHDLEGPYELYTGPYHIRTTLVFHDRFADDWTSNHNLPAIAEAAFANLNSAFNKHHIYFYPSDFEDCYSSYQLESSSRTEAEILADNPDAFTIFVTTDAGGTFGQNWAIPNKFTTVYGNENGVLVTATSILIHEVGHCLGLIHLNGTTQICPEGGTVGCQTSPGPQCYCCGDMVCDTPIFNDQGFDAPDCTTAVNHPENPTEEDIRNYMSYTLPTHCRDRFTEGQVHRMWAMLADAPQLQDMQMQLTETAKSGNLPGGVYGNIVVEKGTTLEINSPLEMEPAARIRVEKGNSIVNGGQLIVRSTISAACDEMWQGIVVEGSGIAPQTLAYQGKVVVHSTGKIKHAKVGILAGEPGTSGGGGIVELYRGKFEDNETGISLGNYAVGVNIGKFWLPEFTITDEYRGPSGTPPTMFKAVGNRQLIIRYPKFKDLRTQCDYSSHQAIGADLVGSSSNFPMGGIFENLSIGIWVDDIPAGINGSFSIGNASFTNCATSIRTTDVSGFSIFNCDFAMGRPASCPSSGLNLIGVQIEGNTDGFHFKGNDFALSNGSTIPTERTIGTLVENTGEGLANTIKENSYSLLYEGILASGKNAGAMDGMLFLCNTITDALPWGANDPYSIHVVPGGAVKLDQGNINLQTGAFFPAGNLFSESAYTFYNDPGNATVNYFFNENVDSEKPSFTSGLGYAGLELKPLNAVGCASDPPCDNPPCPVETVQEWQSGFYLKKGQWQTKKAALGFISDPQQLRAAQDTIRWLRQEMNALSGKLIQQYSLDTNQVEVDSITAWLDRTDTYTADLRLSRHYLFTSDYSNFSSLWQAMPSEHSLTSEEEEIYDELGLIYDLILPELQSGSTVFNLEQHLLDSLLFWSNWCSEPGYVSRSILRCNGVMADCNCLEGGVTSRSSWFNGKREDNPNGVLKIFPNPVSGLLTILLDEKSVSSGSVSLHDVSGRLAMQYLFGEGMDKFVLDVSRLPTGFYFVKAAVAGRTLHVGKVIVNR